MDLFISGVNKITLMWRLIKDKDLVEIREMCAGEIYLLDDTKVQETLKKATKLGFDGIVTKEKKVKRQITNIPVWVISQVTNGEEVLQRIYP